MSIGSVMPSNHLIRCSPLLLLPLIFPSIRVFSNESALHIRWPKYWSFRFNISPSNEHPGLVFRMDWLDLLAIQGTLKSSPAPQFESIKGIRNVNIFFIHNHANSKKSCFLLKTYTMWFWRNLNACILAWHWLVKWSRSVMSDSLRPHGLQPTRLLPPWDSPGKSTGVGCHFLLQGHWLSVGIY